MSKTGITAEPGIPQIIIAREFGAPRDLVYRAHVDPELTIDQYDARNGGIWRYTQKDPQGNQYGFHGVFHGDPSPDAIVQTFEFEGVPGHVCLQTVTFAERGDATLMRTVMAFQSVEDRDQMVATDMERGVRDSGDRLDELFAKLAAA